MVKTQGQK